MSTQLACNQGNHSVVKTTNHFLQWIHWSKHGSWTACKKSPRGKRCDDEWAYKQKEWQSTYIDAYASPLACWIDQGLLSPICSLHAVMHMHVLHAPPQQRMPHPQISQRKLSKFVKVFSPLYGTGWEDLGMGYPCELYFTSDCGSRCCSQVHAWYRLPVVVLWTQQIQIIPNHLGSTCTRGKVSWPGHHRGTSFIHYREHYSQGYNSLWHSHNKKWSEDCIH